ncbi:MAG TPA: DUF6569 family protein [Longimicrobiales bacterium]|nr:DUF6569 family protein [Longimicrobiales bacterium]
MLPINIAPPQTAPGLTIFPLIGRPSGQPGYELLPDALEAGSLVITEVSEQGSVPELLAINDGPRDVLVLDGMQLIGAMQNRTVGRSILLPAHSRTRIPVSCMERGRWRSAGRWMKSGRDHSPVKVRRRTRTVEASAATSAPETAARQAPAQLLSMAQGQVWDAIHESSARHRAHSATDALDDVYQAARPRLEELQARFHAVEGQVGLVAFLGNTPAGADVLDNADTYAKVHNRLVRGYLFEALESPSAGNGVTMKKAVQFVAGMREVERRPLPTVGRGQYRALAGAMVGGELAVDGRVVHVSAFPA